MLQAGMAAAFLLLTFLQYDGGKSPAINYP
jgi:hypothetical protein